jgi:hypothetical protein
MLQSSEFHWQTDATLEDGDEAKELDNLIA